MSLYIWFLIVGAFFLGFFILLTVMIKNAKKGGELVEEIEEARKTDYIQDRYSQISSRPAASSNELINRMRDIKPDGDK